MRPGHCGTTCPGGQNGLPACVCVGGGELGHCGTTCQGGQNGLHACVCMGGGGGGVKSI